MRALRGIAGGVLIATLGWRVTAAQEPPLASLLQRAAERTLRYEERFAVVIGDEEYEQHVNGRSYSGPRDRTIASEMMFLWLTGERTWLAVRNVVNVDGGAIKNSRKRLDLLLSAGAPVGVAHLRRMRDEGARFNIGSIRRNFNDPMFPLRFLEPETQRRFTFALAGQDTIGGTATSKVTFDEQAAPTFIQNGTLDLPSHGIFWMGEDGRVLRTRIDIRDPLNRLSAFIIVNYGHDSKLDMLVPVTMHETYLASGPNAERVECHAQYSGFRRFETAARMVPDR